MNGAGRVTRGVRWLTAGIVALGMAWDPADPAAAAPPGAAALVRPPGKAGESRTSKRTSGPRRSAQRRAGPAARRPPKDRPPAGREEDGPRRLPRRPPRGRALRDNPFRPAPQDLGPLRPGEAEQLLGFARQRMPHVYDALQRLRRQNPQRFDRRLADLAPRLRQLRRLFDEDPGLAKLLVEHIRNVEKLNRIRMFIARNRNRSEAVRRAAGEVRRIMADLRRIEIDVLQRRIDQLTRERDELVEQDFARLLDPSNDLLGEPPEIRRIVGRLRRARSERERSAIEQQLRNVCQRRIDERIGALQQRVRRMRSRAADEIEQRVRQFIENARRGRGHDIP